MPDLTDLFPPLLVGIAFTSLAGLKIYGMTHGIQGGGGTPFTQRACGSCPTWSRGANKALVLLFVLVGVANLAFAASMIFRHAR